MDRREESGSSDIEEETLDEMYGSSSSSSLQTRVHVPARMERKSGTKRLSSVRDGDGSGDEGEEGEEEEQEEEEEEEAMSSSRRDLQTMQLVEEQSEEVVDEDEQVQVDFDVQGINEEDLGSIRTFLTRFVGERPFDAQGMVEDILAHPDVGSVVKVFQDDEEYDVFGFVSVLNLHVHENATWAQQLFAFLIEACRDDDAKRRAVEEAFFDRSRPLGLLLNEHAINLPLPLIPPLHRCLFEEIAESSQSDEYYRFGRYIMLSTAYGEPERLAKKSKRKKKGSGLGSVEAYYVKQEDGIYQSFSSTTVSFPMEGVLSELKPGFEESYRPSRVMFILEAAKTSEVLEQLAAFESSEAVLTSPSESS